MGQEAQEAGERALEGLKQRVFASSFGSIDPRESLSRYYEVFEKQNEPDPEYDYDVEAFEPESEADVQQMLNEARRLGIVS